MFANRKTVAWDATPVIRQISGGVVVQIPSNNDAPQPMDTGVLDAGLCPVSESITWRGNNRWTFDPRVPPEGEITEMPGNHMFAGLMYGHFGRFLVESTARLWALDRLGGNLDGIIFVPKIQRGLDRVLKKYQTFLDLLGIDLPVINLADPARVENLYVPQQGFGMFGLIVGTQEYRDFMRDRLGKRISADGPKKIYVSRSDLTHQRGGLFAETRLEELLKSEGFEIFHPQNHSFEVQLAAYKAADVIISPDGSPLHMAALVARPETKPLPTGVGRILDMLLQVLKYDVLSDGTVGG